jgi:xylulokinase/glycerol kinase
LGYSEKPQFHDQEKTLCSAGTIPGSYFIEAGLITSGILMQWFVEQFLKELPKEDAFSIVFKEIMTSQVGANGVVFMPHFKGVAAPFWNPLAKGVFFNTTLSTTRGDMARSVLEGISLDMALNFALVKETMGGTVERVAIAGGMTRREIFNQMQADVYNQPVWIADSAEASSLGAWMSGVVAIGAYKDHEKALEQIQAKNPLKYVPDSEAVAMYDKIQQKRLKLYDALVSSKVYEAFAEC